MWAYVYNIVRMYSREIVERAEDVDVLAGANDEESNTNGDHTSLNCTEPHLPAVANLPMPPVLKLFFILAYLCYCLVIKCVIR